MCIRDRYLHRCGLPVGPGVGLMTLEYVFHKSAVLLYATVMLSLIHIFEHVEHAEGTKPRTASSIGMFDMLKGAGMLTIVFAHTAELYPMQARCV